ncbi:uncharacterized protein LOC135343434 [Halichondria panicea]|uniref:uncharacterized protein LOC135343434 n=1 Tax=Halichondria panicea TaxID=6063 RepID=UPI00312BB7D6
MKASNGLKLSSCVFVLLVGLLVKHTTSQVVLGFSEEDYAVVEGRNAMVTVTKNNQNQFPISLSIVPLTYSQYQGIVPTEIQGIIDTVTPTPAQFVQGGRTDFSDLSIPITFPPSLSSDSVTVAVGASDDFINEASEGFIIMLRVDQIDPADGTPTFVREGVALMRITDDDAVSISFSAPSYDVSEGAGLLSNLVFIVKDLESEQNLTVIISRQITSAGASFATPDVDFVDIVTMSFTFLPADTMLPIAIEILEDTEPEADEMFTLIISIPPGQPRVTPGTPPQAAVVIADDDGTTLEVGFLQTTYTVMEGEDAVITFGLLTDPTLLTADDFAVIDIEVVADTATSSVDYDSSAVADGFYFIAVGGATSSFTIPTTLDTDVEGSESFVVRLAFSQEVGNVAGDFVVRESNRQATVIIQEPGGNEPTVLELTPSPSLAGIEGDIITFTCGPPENDPITLLVNGLADTTVAFDDATGNRTYSLGPLDRNMEGNTYQCTSGTRMSEITTLSVYYPPVFTVGAFFEGNEGDALRINLSLDGNPLPLDSFSWTYDGQPLSAETGRLVFGAEFIEFTPLQRTDRGRYMITGSNLAGNGSAFFDLEVYYVPSYIADPVYTVIEGQPGQIQLSLDARPLPGPSEFSWSRDGVPISSSGQVTLTSDSIDWSSVNRSDGGAYMVVATNRAGSGTASFQVVVIYPPVYTVDSRIAVVEGDLVRINLTLDANPDPTSFTWTRDGVPFTPPPGGSVGVNFIDFGGPINRTAGGSYTVQSTNDAGTGNATFQLEILYPADSRIVVVEGSPILINLDANPNPTSFFWTRNGVPFTPPPGGSVGPNFIDFGGPISRSAEGTYTVQSTSDAGTVNSTFQLEVIHPPVYTVDSRIAVVEGDLVRINLTLDANPDPTSFTWTRDGVPFTPPPGGSVGVNFIDFGGPINRTAGGTYTVQSTNDAGTGNATFQLDIYYPPVITVNNTFTVLEGEVFDLTLLVDSLPVLTDDNVTWFFNNQVIPGMMGISFGADFIRIDMVTRLDGGTYRVEGTNVAGTGEASFSLQVVVPIPTTVIPTATSTPTLMSTSVPVLSTTSMPNPTTSVPRPTVTPTPEPPVTTVTEPPQTTGGMGGDPHFNILLPNHQQLCFSIQGEHGYSFNLISNKLIHMNARFIPDPKREEVTWIGSLGIVVTSSTKMNATRIRFEAEDKMIYIGEKLSLHVKKIDRLTFTNGKLTISEALRDKKEKRFRVHVELVDIGLSFCVDFVKGHLDMTWNKVGKQPANSHGIIGQFFRPHIEIDEARRLLLLPTLEPVAVMRKPVWHFMERESPDEKLCWVAMNQGYQGKGLLQGHYLDYLVDDVLTPDFKFKLRKHKMRNCCRFRDLQRTHVFNS